MTDREAEKILEDAELVPAIQGSLAEVKRIRQQCLDEGVPVSVAPPECSSCGTKLSILVREEDLPRVGALLRREWADLVEREGTARVVPAGAPAELGEDEEPPCPACGTAAPLVDGACSDCGLRLG